MRPDDEIVLETRASTTSATQAQPVRIEKFERLEMELTIQGPSTATFEIGDESAAPLFANLQHGVEAVVTINGRPALTGKIISDRAPIRSDGGIVATFAIETIIGAASICSGDPNLKVGGYNITENPANGDVIVKQQKYALGAWLAKLYGPLGVKPTDFITRSALDRDILTGIPSRGGKVPADFAAVMGDQVKINPGDIIYEAAANQLRRFSMGHWDSPNGGIYVGPPDDDQFPIGRLVYKSDPTLASANNVIEAEPIRDWSEVPSVVRTHGTFASPAQSYRPIVGRAEHKDVLKAWGHRPVIVKGEFARGQAQSDAHARRELASRSKQKDAVEVRLDGWSFWDGKQNVPIAPNTTWDVDLDVRGGIIGIYYCLAVRYSLDDNEGPTVTLVLTRQGTFTFGGGTVIAAPLQVPPPLPTFNNNPIAKSGIFQKAPF